LGGEGSEGGVRVYRRCGVWLRGYDVMMLDLVVGRARDGGMVLDGSEEWEGLGRDWEGMRVEI
jgi:hypothetical protein